MADEVSTLPVSEDSLKARGHEQALLVEIISKLAAAVNVEAVLEPILSRLRERSGLTRAAIYVLNSETGLPRCLSESGLRLSEANRIRGLEAPELVERAGRTGQAVYVPDVTRDPRSLCDDPKTRSQYAVPLLKGSSVLGVLEVQSAEQDGIRAVLRKLLDQVAVQIALALERNELQKDLRISDERVRAVLEQEHFGVALRDLAGRYTTVNPAFAHLLGYEPEEMRGRLALDFIHPEDRPRTTESWKTLSEDAKGNGVLERRLLHKSGEALMAKAVISILRDGGGRPVCGLEMLENLTDRRKNDVERAGLRELLFKAQKMEGIGTLAGGLAHDFNNLLGVILGIASLVRIRMQPEDPLQESVRMIEQAAESAADLTRDLLGLYRQEQHRRTITNMEELLNRVLKIVTRTFDRRIQVETQFTPRLPPVEAEGGQLAHAILNLCLNARDAMPEGGKLRFETSVVTLGPSDSLRPSQCSPGEYLRITVKDSGLGIEPQVLPHLFEPYFTTKEAGRGTGLGLAMVHRIVHSHGGFVRVESEVVRGSQFSIFLPAARMPEQFNQKEEPVKVQYGSGTALVVDDEPLVLAFVERGLEKLGYNVLTAQNGKIAAEIYAQRAREIDFVILDMVMPELSGLETYQRLREINPQVKVILSSGYSLDRVAREALEMGGAEFLGKPYTLETLSVALKKVHPS